MAFGDRRKPLPRGKPLDRGSKPLARGEPMKRGKPLRAKPPDRPLIPVPRARISQRSDKRITDDRQRGRMLAAKRAADPECSWLWCSRVDTDGHEILTRGRGGSITNPANIVLLCREHHDLVTLNPGWSDRHGWTVPSTCTPAQFAEAGRLRGLFRCDIACPDDHRTS